ncbi:hypothetical protein [Gracilimonas tropica]|uniref:hypothetical protein n=1 Tax=Gracilimonas tropica TaxID=454600 RepID=UPI000375032D|nr:hypothetical protein [Gracilimonas tropica]
MQRIKLSKSAYRVWGIVYIVFFVVPMIAHLYSPEAFSLYFSEYDHIENSLYVVLFFVITAIFYKQKVYLPLIFKKIPNLYEKRLLVYLLVLLYLFSSVYFSLKYGINFRHKSNLSEEGFIPIMLFALSILSKNYLLYLIFKKIFGFTIKAREKIVVTIIIFSIIMSFNASQDVLFIGAGLLLLFNSLNFVWKNKSINNFKNVIKDLNYKIILTLISVLVVLGGFLNKRGFEGTVDLLKKENISNTLLITIQRISVHYFSVIVNAEYLESDEEEKVLSGMFEKIKYRGCVLIGNDCRKTDVGSVSNLNAERINPYQVRVDAGATPGLIASVFFFPNLLIGYLFVTMYWVFLMSLFSHVLNNRFDHLSWSGAVLIAFLSLIVFFPSPVDMLNIFSKPFIGFISFYFTCLWFINLKKKHESILIFNSQA